MTRLGLALGMVGMVGMVMGCGGEREHRMPDAGPPIPEWTCEGCTATPIGSPIWQPVDLTIFAAPVGSGMDSVFPDALDHVFNPNHGFDMDNLLVAPRVAHP